MTRTRYAHPGGARPLAIITPTVTTDVFTTKAPGIFHVRIIETAPGGDVIRQACHRLRAANAETAAHAGLWLFNHSCRFDRSGYFVWR